MGVIDIFKFALQHFYPKRKVTYEDTDYISIDEAYENVLNTVYLNGGLYVGEALDNIGIETKTRSINEYAYLLQTNARLYFCVELHNFSRNQYINITCNYTMDDGDNRTYTANGKRYDGNITHIPLSDEITLNNINMITIDTLNIELENHTKYLGVPQIVYSREKLFPLKETELNTLIDNVEIMQKYTLANPPQIIRYSENNNNCPSKKGYGFKLRNIKPVSYDNTQMIGFVINNAYNDGVKITNTEDVDYNQESNLATSDFIEERLDDCLNANNDGYFDKIILTLVVNPKGQYEGMNVRLTYENVAGNEYKDPVNVEYLPITQ